MTPERWSQVEALFEAALELPSLERTDFLAARCGEDHALLEEVVSLLRHEEAAGDGGLQPRTQFWADPEAHPAALSPDTAFGPYQILRLLGEGGMGEVYLAEDTRLERKVALKLLAGWLRRDEQVSGRFAREAVAASALNHPNIPVVYDTGEINQRRFIASEFVDGETLSARLAQGPMDWRAALPIALQVAAALQAAHGAGIVHRDVKPANILVCGDGRVKLVDFGIAHYRRARATDADAQLTQVGAVLGTPGYMAPEQEVGDASDARSDLWSLTAVLQQMLTGQRPSLGRLTIPAGIAIPAPLLAVLERGLQTDPAVRYQSAGEWITAVEAATSAARVRAGRSAGRRGLAIAAGILVPTVMLAMAALLFGRSGWRHAFGAPDPSLAVLQFDNLPAGSGTEYITQGIQAEILARLARISSLKVLSPHAIAGIAPHPAHLEELGTRLGVGSVLEGSLQVQGQRVRLAIELIDTATGAQRWADSFDREIRDVFDVERDIAERVAQQLKVRLLPTEQAEERRSDTQNPQAHDAAMLGRFFRARGDEASLRKALSHFEDAVRLDPGYAAAYAEMSIAWFDLSSFTSGADLTHARDQSRAAAQHAIELDPTLPDAHVALGWVFLVSDWDFHAAEHEFQQAVALAPNSARAKNGLGTLSAFFGRFEQAAALIEQARALDPLNGDFANNLAQVRQAQGRDREAEQLYRTALELAPGEALSHAKLAELALRRNAMDTALREAKLETDDSARDFTLTLVALRTADPSAAASALETYIRKYREDSPFSVAELYAFRGDSEHAFEWLDRAYAARDGETSDLILAGMFARFYGDPRFRAFCARLGLPVPEAGNSARPGNS